MRTVHALDARRATDGCPERPSVRRDDPPKPTGVWMEMSTLLSTSLGRRPLRSLNDLIDRRIEVALQRSLRPQPPGGDDLRPVVAELQKKVRSLELLLDGAGRGMGRMPAPGHLA